MYISGRRDAATPRSSELSSHVSLNSIYGIAEDTPYHQDLSRHVSINNTYVTSDDTKEDSYNHINYENNDQIYVGDNYINTQNE